MVHREAQNAAHTQGPHNSSNVSSSLFSLFWVCVPVPALPGDTERRDARFKDRNKASNISLCFLSTLFWMCVLLLSSLPVPDNHLALLW